MSAPFPLLSQLVTSSGMSAPFPLLSQLVTSSGMSAPFPLLSQQFHNFLRYERTVRTAFWRLIESS
jgi:hypothetical protein